MSDTLPPLPERLRNAIYIRKEWRVQDPKDGSYCIAFSRDDGYSLDPEREARKWLADHQARFPTSSKAGYVVACVPVMTQADKLMQEAADEIERLQAGIRELVAASGAETMGAAAVAEPVAFDADGFRAFVLRELPDNTIIGRGAWWADHLTAWAHRFIKRTAAPPQREREPLTDKQIAALLANTFSDDTLQPDDVALIRAVERAHGITKEQP